MCALRICGRLHEELAEGDHRELEGEAAGAPDAALDGLGELAQVGVEVVELGPGVGDADDGAPVEHEVAEALGLEPRAVGEAVEVAAAEPVAASERVCCHCPLRGHDYRGRHAAEAGRSRVASVSGHPRWWRWDGGGAAEAGRSRVASVSGHPRWWRWDGGGAAEAGRSRVASVSGHPRWWRPDGPRYKGDRACD